MTKMRMGLLQAIRYILVCAQQDPKTRYVVQCPRGREDGLDQKITVGDGSNVLFTDDMDSIRGTDLDGVVLLNDDPGFVDPCLIVRNGFVVVVKP